MDALMGITLGCTVPPFPLIVVCWACGVEYHSLLHQSMGMHGIIFA